MKLRCKQGDLAIVTKSVCGNIGKVVTCLELVPCSDSNPGQKGNYWRIDRPLKTVLYIKSTGKLVGGGVSCTIPDENLTPINPDNTSDEDKEDNPYELDLQLSKTH